MYQAFLLPPVWALMWSKNFFCSCSFCVCYFRSRSTVPAACTILGVIIGPWSTKRTRVMGKGMVTFFWLTFLATLRGYPLWRQAFLWGDGAYMTNWTQIFLIASEFQIPALPCRGFLPLLELGQHGPAGQHIRMALMFRMLFGPSLLKAWACQMSTQVHMAQLNLPPVVIMITLTILGFYDAVLLNHHLCS